MTTTTTTPTAGGFGKPKYVSGPAWKSFKLEDGKPLIARILPPMKSLADEGKWEEFQKQHFGYEGKGDGGKNRPRPFGCREDKDFRSGMIKCECKACNKREEQNQLLESTKGEMIHDFKAAHPELTDKKALEAALAGTLETAKAGVLKPLSEWLKHHNCDRKWAMNIMDLAGDFGPLRLSNDTNKKLKAKIKEALEIGIDPLDLETGLFFVFTRTGKQLDVVDTIEIYSETTKANGKVTSEWKSAPLSAEQVAKALEVCPDLPSLITWLTEEQVEAIVEGSGDPAEVDAIFGMSQHAEKRESSPPPLATPKPKLPVAATAQAAPPASTETIVEPPSETGAVQSAPVGDPSTLSDAEFLKKYS